MFHVSFRVSMAVTVQTVVYQILTPGSVDFDSSEEHAAPIFRVGF
jgi:hypothetical protein